MVRCCAQGQHNSSLGVAADLWVLGHIPALADLHHVLTHSPTRRRLLNQQPCWSWEGRRGKPRSNEDSEVSKELRQNEIQKYNPSSHVVLTQNQTLLTLN